MRVNRQALRQLPRALQIEVEENIQRKDLSESEIGAVQRKLLNAVRQQAQPGRRVDLTGETEFSQVRDRATAVVGKAFDESHKTVERRLAVLEAADDEPQKYGKFVQTMNRTGRVNGVYKLLKIAKQAERIRAEPPPLPGNGPYRFAVVDFPWLSLRQGDPSQEGTPPYPPMTNDEILQFAREKLRPLMHHDSVLALWSTNFHLIRQVAPILDAAGFSERTILTWVKTRSGTGTILFGQSEHCVIAFRGHPTITLTNESTVLFAPVRGHSVKPVEFYDLVERWCPAPRYLDLFSRYRHNDKWDTYGDEAPEQMAPLEAAAE